MTLLPDVERELLRAARKPVPVGSEADPAPGGRPTRKISWVRPTVSGALVIVFALLAVGLGGIFLVVLHRGGAVRPSGQRQGPAGTFPGAPATQRGDWPGAVHLCPLAPRNRYLPARSGCLTVIRADVDGDGRPDLVLLYGRLSHQRIGDLYVPTSFVLKVVRGSGGVVQTRIPAPEADPTILEVGPVSDDPGVELFILVARISSGSSVEVYSFHAGRLIDAGPTLGVGGDSAQKAGFACPAGRPPTIVQHSFLLEGPGESGWWQRTDITYAWHDATLTQITRHTSMRRGIPPLSATGLGVGCGTITPTGSLEYPQARDAHPTRTRPPAIHICQTRQLQIRMGYSSAGLGSTGAYIEFINRSRTLCQLHGWPTLVAQTDGHAASRAQPRPGSSFPDVTAVGVPAVTLAPDQRADAVFSASDGPTSNNKPCGPSYRTLHVIPPRTPTASPSPPGSPISTTTSPRAAPSVSHQCSRAARSTKAHHRLSSQSRWPPVQRPRALHRSRPRTQLTCQPKSGPALLAPAASGQASGADSEPAEKLDRRSISATDTWFPGAVSRAGPRWICWACCRGWSVEWRGDVRWWFYRFRRDFGRRLGVRCDGAVRGGGSCWRRGGRGRLGGSVAGGVEAVRSGSEAGGLSASAAYAGAVVLDDGGAVSGVREPAGARLDAADGLRPGGRVDLRAAVAVALPQGRPSR